MGGMGCMASESIAHQHTLGYRHDACDGRRMKLFVWSFVAASLTGLACTPAPIEVHTGALDTAPYAQFHTFALAPIKGGIVGYTTTARSERVINLMKPAVTAVLVRKGYTLAAETESDLVIVCSAGRRDTEEHRELPRRMAQITGEQYEDRDFVEGGLVIDVFDKTGGQVWHGAAQTEIDPQKPDDARVRTVVEHVLEKFPARPPSQ